MNKQKNNKKAQVVVIGKASVLTLGVLAKVGERPEVHRRKGRDYSKKQ